MNLTDLFRKEDTLSELMNFKTEEIRRTYVNNNKNNDIKETTISEKNKTQDRKFIK